MNKAELQLSISSVLLTVFTRFAFFHRQVCTGHIIIPSALLWLQSEFPLMTAVSLLFSGSEPALSTFHWWTCTAICLNKLIPAARLNLWKTHHCDNFRHVLAFQLGSFCNLCYLSPNKNRITLMSAHLSKTELSSCVSFFLFRRITTGSAAETCQEMNSRLIQALNVLQMTTS